MLHQSTCRGHFHTISNDNLKVGTWLFLFCSPISSPARQHFFSSSSSFLLLPLAPQPSFNFLIFLLFSSGHSQLILNFIFLMLSSQLCLSSSSFVYPFELFRVLQASPGKQFLQFCFLQFFSFLQYIIFLVFGMVSFVSYASCRYLDCCGSIS